MQKINFHQIFDSEFGRRLAEKGCFKTLLNGKPGPTFNRIFIRNGREIRKSKTSNQRCRRRLGRLPSGCRSGGRHRSKGRKGL